MEVASAEVALHWPAAYAAQVHPAARNKHGPVQLSRPLLREPHAVPRRRLKALDDGNLARPQVADSSWYPTD